MLASKADGVQHPPLHQPDPDRLDLPEDEVVDVELHRPVGLLYDENGQGYFWSRSGYIFILNQAGEKLETPLLDIHEEVSDYWDIGMVGFVLDPDFLENGYFYVLYTVDRHHLLHFGTPEYDPEAHLTDEATIGRITRFQADITTDFQTLVPDSRKVLLGESITTGIPILFKAHGVGSLVFGEDGTLLVSCGETGWPNWIDVGSHHATYYEQALADGIIQEKEDVGVYRSQLVDCLGGKILRIDSETGNGIPSNPFYDPNAPRAPRSRVWELGLRNPYKFMVVPNTGSHLEEDGNPGILFIGDVGSVAWEEFMVAKEGGENFGWPIWEGYDLQSVYHEFEIENLDAPNPLFGQNGCEQPYFYFSDLIKSDRLLNRNYQFANPCDSTQFIPADIPLFYHQRPKLAYSNHRDTLLPKTKVGTYDADGAAMSLSIDDPDSPVAGALIDGSSSIPGVFYEGDNFPEDYHGKYFHVDINGWIKIYEFDADYNITKIDDFYSDIPGKIVNLIENPNDGCLYYVNWVDKNLHRICYGGIPAPIPVIKMDKRYGASPLSVQFQGEQSHTTTDFPLTFSWDFGDGTSSEEMNPSHLFSTNSPEPLSFEVKLTVTDSSGQAKSTTEIVSLNNTPPNVQITSIVDGSKYPIDETQVLRLRGDVTDIEHNEEDLTYTWRSYLHHNTHQHQGISSNKKQEYMLLDPLGCAEENYWFRIELEVADVGGLKSFDEVEIFPNCDGDFFELEYFYGEALDKEIKVIWNAKNESEVLQYELQKSDDYLNYETLGTFAAGAITYNFSDLNPVMGTNIYRLKIIGKHQSFDFSKFTVVQYPVLSNIVVFPNPARHQITVSINNAKENEIKVRLYNSLGKTIIEQKYPAIIGDLFVEELNVFSFPQGIYYLEIKNGLDRRVEKVIIGR